MVQVLNKLNFRFFFVFNSLREAEKISVDRKIRTWDSGTSSQHDNHLCQNDGQVTAHLKGPDLLARFESDFRRCHSNEAAVINIANDVHSFIDRGKNTHLVFIDLSAAFDTIH